MKPWQQAEKDFVDSFDKYGKGAFVHRFTDTAAAKATSGVAAFIAAQPSDYLVVHGDLTFFAEVKSCRDPHSFPHGNIQKNQMAKSRMINAAGGNYLFFIKNELTQQWYCIPAAVIHNNREAKSTKWSDVADYTWSPL